MNSSNKRRVIVSSLTGGLAAIVVICALYYAKELFSDDLDHVPEVQASLVGVENTDRGYVQTGNCRMQKVTSIATVSRATVEVTANGRMLERDRCSFQLNCYLRDGDKKIDISSHNTGNIESWQQVINGAATPNAPFYGSISCDISEVTKAKPRLLKVGIEIYADNPDTAEVAPVQIETIFPFTTASTFLLPSGANRNYRYLVALDQQEENKRQYKIFIYAAIFGAAVAAVFEAVLSMLHLATAARMRPAPTKTESSGKPN